jgi:hypothetical protein
MTLRSTNIVLPGTAELKFRLYTLACQELLIRLADIKIAIEGEQYTDCISRFDKVIARFFEDDFRDTKGALDQFNMRFKAEFSSLRKSIPRLQPILDQLMRSIYTKLPSWTYYSDLQNLHTQGRNLARLFFEASPWQVTQERLSHTCHFNVDFDGTEPRKTIMAYSSRHPHTNCQGYCVGGIITRFSFKHTFATYLNYVFLFLHEYTAHVYSLDNQCNPRFNDGWMIYAASKFLEKQLFNTPSSLFELYMEQADAFHTARMIYTLDQNSQEAYWIAARFDTLTSEPDSHVFRDITYELAAFQESDTEKPTWPSKFINGISIQLRNSASRSKLFKEVATFTNVRSLYESF